MPGQEPRRCLPPSVLIAPEHRRRAPGRRRRHLKWPLSRFGHSIPSDQTAGLDYAQMPDRVLEVRKQWVLRLLGLIARQKATTLPYALTL